MGVGVEERERGKEREGERASKMSRETARILYHERPGQALSTRSRIGRYLTLSRRR